MSVSVFQFPQKEGFKVAIRKRKQLKSKPAIEGITKGDIRRLARKGGVKRITVDIYDETRHSIKRFLQHMVRTALIYTKAAKRKTCRPMDVVMAMKKEGKSFYGII